MEHTRIIRRAFDITRVYRALWIFGILLALTTGTNTGSNANYSFDESDMPRDFDWPRNWPDFNFPFNAPEVTNTLIGVGIAVICFFILLAVAFTFLRYISNTALIRMVSGYEASGERVSVRQGFRLGWSNVSFKTWLIDLVFTLAGILVVLISLALVAAPLLLWASNNETAGVIGTVMTIGLFILWLLLVFVAAAVVSLVLELAYRSVVLEGRGVFDAIGRGWSLFRRRLGDVIIMGLLLFGIGLVFSLLMIPVFIILLLAGGVVGGIPALIAGAVTNMFAEGATTPQLVAVMVGLPILLTVLMIPLIIISGLYETFKSTVWTLTFRELLALEAVLPAAPGAPLAAAGMPPAAIPPAASPSDQPPAAAMPE